MDQLNNFTIAFDRLLSGKRDDNSVYLNNQKYSEIVEIVKTAKSVDKKSVLMCRRLKRFDIVRVGNEDRLITPPIVNADNDAEFTYYVKNDEMYDVLHTTHLDIGHGGKHRMFAEAKKRYKNVTQEVIKIYLTCCVSCRSKAKCVRSSCEAATTTPAATILPETNGRCRVDLIDMQSQPDGPYRFIMVYEDCSTKFVQLRPLMSQSAGEVARHVLDIFCTFGAPSILQSDSSGREEFADRVINELGTAWPTLKIVRGKSRHGHHQGRAIIEMPNQDVRIMLAAWMQNEKVTTWSEGLRFVQLTRNGQLRKGMRRSPYRAMFGCDVKFGLATSSAVPKDVINTLTSEEDLERFLENAKTTARDEQHRVEGNIWADESDEEEGTHENKKVEEDVNEENEIFGAMAVSLKHLPKRGKSCISCGTHYIQLSQEKCGLCLKKEDILSKRVQSKDCLNHQVKKIKLNSINK